MSISRLLVLTSSAAGMSSMRAGSTTSSAKSIVAISSTSWSASGRIATRLSFWRMTTLAIATRSVSRIASSNSR